MRASSSLDSTRTGSAARVRKSSALVASRIAEVATASMSSIPTASQKCAKTSAVARPRAIPSSRQLAGLGEPGADPDRLVDLVGPAPPAVGGGEDDEAERVGPQVADGDAAFGGHRPGEYPGRS